MKAISLPLIAFLIIGCGINPEVARREYQDELNKIQDSNERDMAMRGVMKLCGDLGYLEHFGGMDEAKSFRKQLKITTLDEKGIKAECPRYW